MPHATQPPARRIAGPVPGAILTGALLAALLAGCGPAGDAGPTDPAAAAQPQFRLLARLKARALNEASGIQTGADGRLFVHNDEGTTLFVAHEGGLLAALQVGNAGNRDWEDIARVPGDGGPLLVIGDIGDNQARRKDVSLYFLPEPAEADAQPTVTHRVRVRYPDGPRDAESLAWDAQGGRLLILTKRDQPPRLYGVPLDLALWKNEVEAEFLGEMPGLRPPTRRDIALNPMRGAWVSQPTGMDISPDGRRAAVITYRSLYLFTRNEGEGWPEALRRAPLEVVGPPGTRDEGVAFSADGRFVYVTSEGVPAPLYRIAVPQEEL